MIDLDLDYFKDAEGNYIVRHIIKDDYIDYDKITVKNDGKFMENWVISNKFFNKKLKHKINDTVKSIKKTIMVQNKITEKDILSEYFLLKITPEEEFNPLFKNLTPLEITEYTKNSTKIRINLTWEIQIYPASHLIHRGLIGSLKSFWNNN